MPVNIDNNGLAIFSIWLSLTALGIIITNVQGLQFLILLTLLITGVGMTLFLVGNRGNSNKISKDSNAIKD
jgi:hypothetical protein